MRQCTIKYYHRQFKHSTSAMRGKINKF